MSGKLIYYYGTVNSSKTMLLLSIAHNYDACGWKVITIKPSLDTRSILIETRAHVPPRKPDIALNTNESLSNYKESISTANVILIDECQFLTATQVDELRNITVEQNIDILCFGLRTDSNTNLFEASKRLFELADEITEVKTICGICGKRAGFNKKISNNTNLINPGWDTFEQRCFKHYLSNT